MTGPDRPRWGPGVGGGVPWDGTFHHPRVSLETGVDLCPPVDGTCVLFASQTESNDLGS